MMPGLSETYACVSGYTYVLKDQMNIGEDTTRLEAQQATQTRGCRTEGGRGLHSVQLDSDLPASLWWAKGKGLNVPMKSREVE